jgi:hypothetical protein
MSKLWHDVSKALAPAWDELLVYPCAVLGVILSPIVFAAAGGEIPKFRVHWWDAATSLVITVAVLAALELRGTPEGKRKADARWRRYTLAFFAGLGWRQVVPAIINLIVGMFTALQGLVP